MPSLKKIAVALAASLLPVTALAATIGGTQYATQYDYREFFNATDGKLFRVVLAGTPFAGMPIEAAAGALLVQMQAVKPQPRLTFTYDMPAERPRPDYRMVLVFNAANDFGSSSVCAGDKPRFRAGTAGRLNVYAVYCRNDLALSETSAWTEATGPDDPRIRELFRELFPVLFSDAMGLRPQSGGDIR
jgi:hypothetical protein